MLLLKYLTHHFDTKLLHRFRLVWTELQQQHGPTRHLAQMFPHMASVARSSSLGRSGCLTNHWIFFHIWCQTARSFTQKTCLLQHAVLRKKNKVLSSVFFHFKFSFVLLHSFSISTHFGVGGRRGKEARGRRERFPLQAGIYYC